jgi:hypothetical protein
MVMVVLRFISGQQKKVKYLTSEDNQETISTVNDMIQDKIAAKSGEATTEDANTVLVTTGPKKAKSKEEKNREDELKRSMKEKQDKMMKEVSKYFTHVDSEYFHKKNQVFFLFSILFVLFQGMLNNSCADIPSLLMILALMSAYPYRKQYTKSFLQYTFFVMYYLQFILCLKLINECFVKIEFIQDLMKEYKDSNIVKANDILFGNVDLTKKI